MPLTSQKPRDPLVRCLVAYQIADRASLYRDLLYKLNGVDVTEDSVILAGPWDFNVWYGVHVCP